MNPIVKAIQELEANIYKVVKRRLLQEGPQMLIAYYNDFLQPTTVPDKKAKSGRRYFSRPNDKNKLRTQYGNIQRALQPGETGNITDVVIANGNVQLVSGIDTNAKVQAGPDTVSLMYAKWHEEGTKNFKARPFLNPGFEAFVKEEVPKIMELIEGDLLELYRGS